MPMLSCYSCEKEIIIIIFGTKDFTISRASK